MTATEVIAEIDRLPPEEKRVVLAHVRLLEEESDFASFRPCTAGQDQGDTGSNGGKILAEQWIAVRRSIRPRLPGAVDTFIAERRKDRA